MEYSFSERVGKVVKDSGLRQTEFASRISISQQYLSQICSGKKIPSDRTIADICREFGVNRIWLETGDGEPYAELSRKEELGRIFGDVLSGAPTAKNLFIEAVAQLPDEIYPALLKSWIAAAERMKQLLEENKTE